ncbi:hypothetical protein GCM10009836_14020 [Pseudonocardia ailaonensis]|uniref:Uncharacterized protein n=1 Tax=Pseudonocardia ailaonensis TaxID=367279 RepID=A0ABN2MT99_9PSEU
MTNPEDLPGQGHSAPVSKTASSLFDLRTVIALLFGVYGIVLLILGLVSNTAADMQKTGGWDINRDTGIAMLVIAVLFVLWVRLRPVKAPTPEEIEAAGDAGGPPSH